MQGVTSQRSTPSAGTGAPDGPTGRPVTRRLALGGGLAVTAALAAGCTIGGSDEKLPGGSDENPAGAGSKDGAGSGDGGAQVLLPLTDVPVGGARSVSIDGRPAIVARLAQRSVAAHSARCTHQGCTVFVAGKILQCPCHGSQFDPLTGAVLRGPATLPLPAIPVRLSGDEVVAG